MMTQEEVEKKILFLEAQTDYLLDMADAYPSWLLGNTFQRAFSIFLHNLLAALVIGIGWGVVLFVLDAVVK